MTKEKIIKIIKLKTGNAPDIIYKDLNINNENITLIYSNTVSSQTNINDFILKKLDKIHVKNEDLFYYIKNYIPNNNIKEIKKEDIIFYIFNGFTIILFDDLSILALENKASLNSDIQNSQNEVSLKGPYDAFCENYETNIGLIRKRLKTDKLWFKETTIGSLSKTKVSIFYLDGIVDQKLVDKIYNKIKNINIKYVGNTNYILDAISNTNRSIFPVCLTTERPDFVCELLLEGRIALMVENSKDVIISPCMFIDFFKRVDDYYEKSINVIANRIIRVSALILALLTPAIYISLMTYNIEAIPSSLLINFSIQRDGVPFTTVFEIIAMNFIFQILRESDLRFPGKGGSSISIVGGLVLGQAAVDAGIISPITIIIVGISSISSLAFSSIELIDSIRLWQLFLIILASLFGFAGVLFGVIIILTLLISEKSCGKPYFFPFEPFNLKAQKNAIIYTKNDKFNPQNVFKEDNK